MGKLKEKIKGEMKKEESGFVYHKGSICRLYPPGDETNAEVRERLEKVTEEAQKANICPRCLDNSNGRVRTDLGDGEFCPVCGTPNQNQKGEKNGKVYDSNQR